MSFLQKQLEYTTEMEQEYRSVRKWNHDMENHLFSLNYLIRAKKYHEADAYLETILSELPPEKEDFMKRDFVILFIEPFLCSSIFFLEALLQEYVLFCQIMLLFFLVLTYRRIYLLARRSLKNAQEEEKFQALQKQEQLQKEQEQLFVSRNKRLLHFSRLPFRNYRHFRIT